MESTWDANLNSEDIYSGSMSSNRKDNGYPNIDSFLNMDNIDDCYMNDDFDQFNFHNLLDLEDCVDTPADTKLLNGSTVTASPLALDTKPQPQLSSFADFIPEDFMDSLKKDIFEAPSNVLGFPDDPMFPGDNMLPQPSVESLLAPKEELLEPMDVVVGDSSPLALSYGQRSGDSNAASPTYSSASDASTDSGLSCDVYSTNSDQQLSPFSPDFGHTVSTSPLLSSTSSPLLSPHHASSSSGYSSTSPSSSPLPLPPSPLNGGELSTSYIVSSGSVQSNTPNVNSSPSTSPQFFIQKKSVGSDSPRILNTKKLTVSSSLPLSLVPGASTTTTTTTVLRPVKSTGQTIVLSKSQLLPRSTASIKTIASSSSLSPSVVTLSGVNKTAGISKSPSVSNIISRKATPKPVSVISSSGVLNSPVFKTVNAGGKISSSQGNIITPRLIKTSQNGNVFYIPENGGPMAVKLISSPNADGTKTTLLRGPGLRNFVTTQRRTLSGTSSGPTGVRILKGINLRNFKGEIPVSYQRDDDSDDECLPQPKKDTPVLLTDEERKLANKEKIVFPPFHPLTKAQERDLKRIKRKIRNKISAQDSRKRKKEYVDKLEDKITKTERECDNLRKRVLYLEENEKGLQQKLKHYESIVMGAQPTKEQHSKPHHQSSFLLMMVLTVALFIYPSVAPQGKPSQLLTAVAPKMSPAGNTRSLLEAATTKLNEDGEVILDAESKVSALTDHDYVPAAKRPRMDLSYPKDASYCTPLIDDYYSPPVKKREVVWVKEEHQPIEQAESKGGGDTGTKAPPDDDKQLYSLPQDKEETPAALPEGMIKALMRTIEERLANWTDTQDRKPTLESVSQSLVVELASLAGGKMLREDIELE